MLAPSHQTLATARRSLLHRMQCLALAVLIAASAAGCALPSNAGYPVTMSDPKCPHGRHHHFVLSLEATSELNAFFETGQLGTYTDPQHRKQSPEATVQFLCLSALFPGFMANFVGMTPGQPAAAKCISLLLANDNAVTALALSTYFKHRFASAPSSRRCIYFHSFADGVAADHCNTYVAGWDTVPDGMVCGHGPGFEAPPSLPPTE